MAFRLTVGTSEGYPCDRSLCGATRCFELSPSGRPDESPRPRRPRLLRLPGLYLRHGVRDHEQDRVIGLAGIPVGGGFVSKFLLFSSAVSAIQFSPWFLAARGVRRLEQRGLGVLLCPRRLVHAG